MDIKQQLELQAMYDRQAFQTAPVENAGELTREAIEKMKKADLVAAHVGLGADPAQAEAKTVAILREELIAAVTANE